MVSAVPRLLEFSNRVKDPSFGLHGSGLYSHRRNQGTHQTNFGREQVENKGSEFDALELQKNVTGIFGLMESSL